MSDGLLTTVPSGQLVVAGEPTALSGIVVSDPNADPTQTVSVALTTKSGLLSVGTGGGSTISGSGTTALTVTGTLAEVNTTLATLVYYDNDPGAHTSDTIDVATSDGDGRADDEKLSVGITQVPAEITKDSTLDFKTSDQSMWSSGQALDINEALTLFSAGFGPLSFSAFDGDLNASLAANASLVATLSADSGGVSLDYPIDAAISAPNVVAAGQQFTVTTSDNGLDSSDPRFTAVFPEFKAALDAILTANVSATFSSDLLGSDSFSYNLDKDIPIVSVDSGQTIPIADGFSVTIPTDYSQKSVSVGSGELPSVTLDATTPNIATANIDLVTLVTDIANDLGIPIPPLSGSFLDGAVSYNVISAILHAGLAITQQFTFNPTSLDVDITAPWGQSAVVPLGQSATFTVPTDWTKPVSLTTSYALQGNLVNNTGFDGTADLNLSLLSGSVEDLGSFGPLYQNDFPLYNSGPIYVYNPGGSGGFSLDGFNTPTGTVDIGLGVTSAAGPGGAVIDTTGFTANGAAAIEDAITAASSGLSKTNIYDPATGTGSATADPSAFNAEIVDGSGPGPYQLPDGFAIGVLEPGAGTAELDGNPDDTLLAAAPAAGHSDILKAGGRDTLVGGQAGGVTFVVDSNFTGKILGFEPGDIVDVTDFSAQAINYDGSTLALSRSDGFGVAGASVSLQGNVSTGHLGFTPDGNGGTDVTLYNLAAATLESTQIALPNARVGNPALQDLSLTNSADPAAEPLAATLGGATGDAVISGATVSGIAAGATDGNSLIVGLRGAASDAGPQTGSVTLSPVSDGTAIGGDGQSTPLPAQTISITGTFYRPGAPKVAPTQVTIHVGDPGTIPIAIENADPDDGYSENLIASVVSASGQITASGTTGDIAPGATSSAITVTVPTTTAGVYQGNVTLDFSSDGTGIDGLGVLDLGSQPTPVMVTVSNYAVLALSDIAPTGDTLTNSGNAYTLDLGTLSPGQMLSNIELDIRNAATGLSDLLGGMIAAAGSSAFTIDAPSSFRVGQNGSASIGVTLDTNQSGNFTDTITIDPTSDSGDGTSTPLPEVTITIDATVADPNAPSNLALAAASDTGKLGDDVTADTIPTITGSAPAGDRVTLDDGATGLGTAIAGSDGTWSITTTTLTPGNHTLTATDTDGFGNVSGASAPLDLHIAAPTTLKLNLPIGKYTDYAILTETTPFTGTGEAGATVDIMQGTQTLATTTVDSTGKWSVTPTLAAGAYTVTAAATDSAGDTTTSDPLSFTVLNGAATFSHPLSAYTDVDDLGGRVVLNGPNGNEAIFGATVFQFSDGTVNTNDGDPMVDALYYDSHYYSAYLAGTNPATDYDGGGWKEGRNPDPYFDTNYYLDDNPDVAAAGVNPLTQYEQHGWMEGRNPSPSFDTNAYLKQYPDVAAAGIDPLLHYIEHGDTEGRTPTAVQHDTILTNTFDATYYLETYPDVAASGMDPLQHFLQDGWKEGRNPNADFNTDYYLANNPDVAAAGVDPLLQYDATGWKEGRNPSAQFNTDAYLAANPDVAAAGINPLYHYLAFGINEGRAV